MKISFYSDRMGFDGNWLEKRGLGGSESALINLTTIWKKNYPEDEITVYNGQREKQEFNGVTYKSTTTFRFECKNFNQDAFISLRETTPLNERYIDSKCVLFWSEDDSNEQSIQVIKNNIYFQNRIDLILAVSEYAKNDMIKFGIKTPMKLFRNGYREDWINKTSVKEPFSCVYTSTPFRGLSILSEVWDIIYLKCDILGIKPRLKIFTGMGLYNQLDNPFLSLYKKLETQPNVEIHSPVCQRDLYKELEKCSIMLYPNSYTETSCMSVLEALANNLWTLTTDLGALGEQVKDGRNGYAIKGDPNSIEYKNEFIDKAVELISRPPTLPDNKGLIFGWGTQVELLRKIIEDKI